MHQISIAHFDLPLKIVQETRDGHVVGLLLLCYLFPFLSYCRPYLKLARIVITNQIIFNSLAAV